MVIKSSFLTASIVFSAFCLAIMAAIAADVTLKNMPYLWTGKTAKRTKDWPRTTPKRRKKDRKEPRCDGC